jgi:HD-like signal output (HDOD) protein
MKRILFVDDDANVLAGLRNSLRNRRSEWNCIFALGPEIALKELEGEPFDVVISDMRMPKIDGAAVLTAAKRLQPKAVRIILSGQTELEAVMKSVFVAHVFLAKPCDTESLQRWVERSCNLQKLLEREDLRAALGAVEMLPPAPRCYTKLNLILAKPDSSIVEVARVIEGDMALSAKILQLVNSAFFGLPRKINSVNEAVTYLGTVTIKNLVLALETFSNKLSPALSPREMDDLAQFSLRVGRVARFLASKDKKKAEEAFLAGLLHAVGKLLTVSKEALRDFEEPHWPYLGAYLLGLWGLPHAIIEAIAHHQKPRAIPHESFELVDLVHLAHYLAQITDDGEIPPGLDKEHLRTVGYDEKKLEDAIENTQRCLEEDARASLQTGKD